VATGPTRRVDGSDPPGHGSGRGDPNPNPGIPRVGGFGSPGGSAGRRVDPAGWGGLVPGSDGFATFRNCRARVLNNKTFEKYLFVFAV
jgi:hypothetical protein